MKCMLLAAGLGTRLRPITEKFAKPAVEMLNVPLFYYSTELIFSLKPKLVVANIHAHSDQIRSLATNSGLKMQFSEEKDRPLGSGGGLKHAESQLNQTPGPILVLNADNVVLPEQTDMIPNLLKAHESSGDALATLLVVEDSRVGSEFNGVWLNKKSELIEVAKKSTQSGLTGYHFTGIAVYSERIFKYLPQGESNIFTEGLLPAIQKSGERVVGFKNNIQWFETGDAKNYLKTTEQLLKTLGRSRFLDELLKKFSPQSVFDRQNLVSGYATLPTNFTSKGFLVAGDGAKVKAGASIEDSVLLRDSVAEGNIRNQIVV